MLKLRTVLEKFNFLNNILTFVDLQLSEEKCITVYLYSDASLANNVDSYTQSGFCILLGQPMSM